MGQGYPSWHRTIRPRTWYRPQPQQTDPAQQQVALQQQFPVRPPTAGASQYPGIGNSTPPGRMMAQNQSFVGYHEPGFVGGAPNPRNQFGANGQANAGYNYGGQVSNWQNQQFGRLTPRMPGQTITPNARPGRSGGYPGTGGSGFTTDYSQHPLDRGQFGTDINRRQFMQDGTFNAPDFTAAVNAQRRRQRGMPARPEAPPAGSGPFDQEAYDDAQRLHEESLRWRRANGQGGRMAGVNDWIAYSQNIPRGAMGLRPY